MQQLRTIFVALLIVSLAGIVGCDSKTTASTSDPDTGESTSEKSEEASPDSPDERRLAAPKNAWIERRVNEARERLTSSEAGELVWRSINEHGGLERWYSNGPLYFRFDYQPLGDRTARDTYQTVDTWSSRVRQQLSDNRDTEFGWDGSTAWVSPADAEMAINARFWALTPYYFVAMPFVLADPGVKLEKQGTAELDGDTHDVIKATFGENVGDSPDDYYVVYLNADTGHFGGLRYIVSYPGFFPDGGHSPPKLMVYEGEQTVEGITFATRFPTYTWNKEKDERGEKVTAIEMSEVEFRPETPDAYFESPEDAHLIDGYSRSD
jgi:hypothetical protein